MEPCRTQACTFFAELKLLFICVGCPRCFRYLHIRSNALIENPYAVNFASNKS